MAPVSSGCLLARERVSGGVARLTSPGAVRSGGYPGRPPGLRATPRATKSVALACLHNGIRALLSGRLHVWFAYCGVERHGSTLTVPFSLLDHPGAIPVPLNRPALTLGSGPRGVHDARRWVVRTCADIGRDDLGRVRRARRLRARDQRPAARRAADPGPGPRHRRAPARSRSATPRSTRRSCPRPPRWTSTTSSCSPSAAASASSRAAPTPGARRSRTTARSCGSRRPASSPRTTARPG